MAPEIGEPHDARKLAALLQARLLDAFAGRGCDYEGHVTSTLTSIAGHSAPLRAPPCPRPAPLRAPLSLLLPAPLRAPPVLALRHYAHP